MRCKACNIIMLRRDFYIDDELCNKCMSISKKSLDVFKVNNYSYPDNSMFFDEDLN